MARSFGNWIAIYREVSATTRGTRAAGDTAADRFLRGPRSYVLPERGFLRLRPTFWRNLATSIGIATALVFAITGKHVRMQRSADRARDE